MDKIIFRNISSRVLITLLLAINTGAVYLIKYLEECKFIGSVLSSSLIVYMCIIILDKWLWKYFPFKLLYNLKDISGEYEGVKHYEYYDQKENLIKSGTLKEKRYITQTASYVIIEKISYKSDETESSRSKSIIDNIELERDGNLKITLTYHNKGNMQLGFHSHEGTEILNFTNNGEILGNYYTNRLPYQTKGTVTLNKKQK